MNHRNVASQLQILIPESFIHSSPLQHPYFRDHCDNIFRAIEETIEFRTKAAKPVADETELKIESPLLDSLHSGSNSPPPDRNLLPLSFHENLVKSIKIFEDAGLLDQSNPKKAHLAANVAAMVFGNLPSIIKDSELPISFLQMMVEQLPEITRQIIYMGQLNLTEVLGIYSESGTEQSLELRFMDISGTLRNEMAYQSDSNSFLWNIRKPHLWRWCRVMLEATVHPKIRVFKSKLNSKMEALYQQLEAAGYEPGRHSHSSHSKPTSHTDSMSDEDRLATEAFNKLEEIKKAQKNIKELHNLQDRLIMVIAFIDDIADNLGDQWLTQRFIKIPFGSEEEISTARQQIYDSGRKKRIYLPFFDETVRVWQDTLQNIINLVTKPVFDEHREAFMQHFEEIMSSMTFSVEMNLDYTKVAKLAQDNSEIIGQMLGPNMMVKTFRFLEMMLLEKLTQNETQIKARSGSEMTQTVEKIVSNSQRLASLSNSLATIYRELGECSKANELMFYIDQELLKQFPPVIDVTTTPHQPSTLQVNFEEFCAYKGYRNHFFSDYSKPQTYLDLLATRRVIVKQIFDVITSLGTNEDIYEQDKGPERIAEEALDAALKQEEQTETHIQDTKRLELYLTRLKLIDQYTLTKANDVKVVRRYLGIWNDTFNQMTTDAKDISDQHLKQETVNYINAQKTFLTMYMLFKHNTHGAI